MGFYIECPAPKGKADFLKSHGAVEINSDKAMEICDGPELAALCVVDNVLFEAACFCYNRQEVSAFCHSFDRRHKTFLSMDRQKACELLGQKL